MRIAYGPAPTNPEAWLHGVLTSSTFWTAVAALVSAGALVYIARQTAATRAAVVEARKQADIAAQALETSQTAVTQGQQLVEEAIKARIDVQMPRLRLEARDSVKWPPLEPQPHNGDPQPFPPGEEFQLPGDADRRIIVRTTVGLANESDYTVKVSIQGPFGGLYRDSAVGRRVALPTEQRLKPGAGFSAYFDVERSVAGWAEAYRIREETREGGPSFSLHMVYRSTSDTGAIDRYEVLVQGTVFEPVPGKTDAWRIMETPQGNPLVPNDGVSSIVAVTRPMTRTYYLSLAKNILLEPSSSADD